jgi:hypothetical protein
MTRDSKAGMMSVTAEDIVKSKMSLEAVRYPPELGDGGYAVQIEVNHQLHCLVGIFRRHNLKLLD